MIPTFFGVSLIIFVVLNLAPGKPGAAQQGADVAADARNQGTQESHRIFLEQFNLDKPILFNTLFALDTAELDGPLSLLAKGTEVPVRQRLRAQETLESYGQYSVPHLIALMKEYDRTGQIQKRDVTVYFLRINARLRLKEPFNPHPGPEIREYNRNVDSENARLRELRYGFEEPEERKKEVLAGWSSWYEDHKQRFDYTSFDKLRVFFLETRFATYWKNLVKLDFGVSLVTKEPVFETLISKLRYSLSLSVVSLLLAYLISIPLGIYSAVRKDSPADRNLTVVLFMMYSLPSFFVATVLLILFSEGSDIKALRWFPTGGFQSSYYANLTTLEQFKDVGWHLVLPLICLTYGSLAALSRYMRTGLLEVIRSDYVRTARAKGLPESLVIGKHALRNGLLPILTLLASLLPAVLGGSVIVEYIFGIPGMGLWTIEAIYQRDYNAIMAVQLLTTVLVLVGILITDLSYALVDPRIRFQ
jgi:peptide/nickel transport system permease protein